MKGSCLQKRLKLFENKFRMSSQINQKKIAKNTLMLYMRMGATMLVSLYTSRVVLATLGVENFGIYNVVGSVVVMFSFMNLTLTTSIRRFLAYELGKGGEKIQSIFNSSVIAVLIASVIIVIGLETIGLWFLNNQLNIPVDRMGAANFVFQFSILSFFVGMNMVPYSSAIVAYEKMGIYAYIGIFDVVLRLLIVFLIQYLPGDKLKIFSVLTFSASLFSAAINFIYCKWKVINTTTLFPFQWKDVSAIFSFSAWSVMGTLIFMMATQGINMIYNIFFGVAVNAALGVAQQVTNAIGQFIGNFQTAFNPQLTKSYSAEGLSENTFKFVCQTSRFTILLILVLSVPLIVNMSPILSLWLEKVPNYAVPFTIISILYISIDGSAGPLYLLVYAKGDVKIYQIILSSIQLLYVAVVLMLCYCGLSPEIILTANIVNVILLYLGRIYILKTKMDFPVMRYVRNVVTPLFIPISLFVVMAWALRFMLPGESVVETLMKTGLSVLIVIAVCFMLYLTQSERQFVVSAVREKVLGR